MTGLVLHGDGVADDAPAIEALFRRESVAFIHDRYEVRVDDEGRLWIENGDFYLARDINEPYGAGDDFLGFKGCRFTGNTGWFNRAMSVLIAAGA